MATFSIRPSLSTNLDYFSFSSESSEVHTPALESPHLYSNSISPLQTSSATETKSKSSCGRTTEYSPRSHYSTSSPSTNVSPSSNLWETSSFSDTVVIGTQNHIESALSGSLPILNTQVLKPESDDSTYINCLDDSYSSLGNIAFNDWMRWPQADPTEIAISPDFLPKLEPLSPDMSTVEIRTLPLEAEANSVIFRDTVHVDRDALFESTDFRRRMDSLPPRSEGALYSTPLSWDTPQPGLNFNTEINETHNDHINFPKMDIDINNLFSPLSHAQESNLREIAMPRLARSAYNAQQYTHSDVSSQASSPEVRPVERKRKSRSATNDSLSSGSSRGRTRRNTDTQHEPDHRQRGNGPIKKTAHNMIEKRYRTNLNDKIAALRDSVPSLRMAAVKLEECEDGRGQIEKDKPQEDLQGLAPAHKLNKATVLSKATEYIAHLEQRARRLKRENDELKRRVAAFEVLVGQQQQQQPQLPPQQQRRRN